MDGTIADFGWILALGLMMVAWVVLAGLPGAPIRGRHRWLLAAGGLVIVVGYVLLAVGPADNPISLTAAPVCLVVGYCVLVPYAIGSRR